MPAFWIKSIDEGTGEVVLSDGRTFNLSDIPGNGWPESRLRKLAERAQELIDNRMRQADLPADDPDRTLTDAQLRTKYNNRCFLDGQDIVWRSTVITFTHDGTRLIPRSEVVR